jgi:hypothetical protein
MLHISLPGTIVIKCTIYTVYVYLVTLVQPNQTQFEVNPSGLETASLHFDMYFRVSKITKSISVVNQTYYFDIHVL